MSQALLTAQAGAARDGDTDGKDGGDKATPFRIQKPVPLTLLCCSESAQGCPAWPGMGMTSSCGQATPSADHPQVGTPSPLVLQLLLITEVYEVAHKGTSLQQTQEQTVGADFGRSSSSRRRLCCCGERLMWVFFGFALMVSGCCGGSPALGVCVGVPGLAGSATIAASTWGLLWPLQPRARS